MIEWLLMGGSIIFTMGLAMVGLIAIWRDHRAAMKFLESSTKERGESPPEG